MSDLSIDLHWQRLEPELEPGGYSAAHTVQFNDSHEVIVDAAPDWGGAPGNANPEQALAAALLSCHMMTFLALAARPTGRWRPITTMPSPISARTSVARWR